MTEREIDPIKFGVLIGSVETLISSNAQVRGDLARHQDAIRAEFQTTMQTFLDRVETSRVENREEHQKLFKKIEDITEEGCPLGIQHSKDIAELKSRPERLASIGAAVVAAVAAIVAVWKGH